MDDMDYGKDTRVRWDYYVIPLDASGMNNPGGMSPEKWMWVDMLGSLREKGEEGWELVCLADTTGPCVLKRPYTICPDPDCNAKLVVGTETLYSAHGGRCSAKSELI